jgi:iron complex outermembrane receptor protein
VTITADKRTTEVQKTPIAVTVFTNQQLEDAGVKTIGDVFRMAPNITSFKALGEGSFMSFRGAITSLGTKTSPLVMYLDGVPVDTYFNLDASLIDIERIEILRGGQGTMYGKNALGGVINIISKKPTNEYRGKIRTFGESNRSYGVSATVSGPIVEDRFFFGLAAQHDYQAGWLKNRDNDRNYERTERVKGVLRLTPNDRAELNLHLNYTAGRDGFYPVHYGPDANMLTTMSSDDYQKDDTFNAALQARFDFDKATLESTTTYRNERLNYRINYHDLYPVPINATYGLAEKKDEREEITQELRLRSPDGNSGFQWLIGLYGSYTNAKNPVFSHTIDYFGFNYISNNPTKERTTDFAPFGQIILPLTESLKFTAGLRWQYTERDFKITMHDNLFYPTHSPSAKDTDRWSDFMPRFALNYEITDDHMVYASASKSFIPGGFNWASLDSRSLKYDKQTAWTYEAGVKTSWLDKRLTANLTFFYNDFTDMQVMHWEGPNITDYIALNVPKAHSYGAELELSAILTQGLTADLTAGITEAKYDRYIKTNVDAFGTLTEVDLSGKNIQHTPEFTGNVALTYRHPIGLFARGQVNYIGKMYWDDDNEHSRKDVVTVDARVGYEGESFDVYIYGRNIFGERYQLNYMPITNVGMVAEPQVFGLELTYKF